jgi:signal transduction histidine kinase
MHQQTLPRAEAAFTRADLRALNLIEQPVWVFDLERKKMWWANLEAISLWNADSLESLLSRNFAEDMSESTERRLADYTARFRKGEKVKDQWTFYPNGQDPKTVDTTASGFTGEDGRSLMLMQGVMKTFGDDIDKATLRGVEMLRHLPIAVTQFDINGNIMDQNPKALDEFGDLHHEDSIEFAEEERCDFLSRFCDHDLGKKILQGAQNGEEICVEAEQRTSRGPRCCTVKIRRTKDPVTSNPVILYSARDITEVFEAKREADRANMAKSEFLAVMAHEIRTPLHQVIGFLELLVATNLDSEQLNHVALMQCSATSLMTVINDLLDYTKLEAGKMSLESIPFEVKAVVEGSVAAVAPAAEQKGLETRCAVGNHIPVRLLGDANRLRQILLNLLQNAIKFTSTGTVATSCYRVDNDSNGRVVLRFVVEDTGIGIGNEFQKRIFHRYQQEHAATARHYGGTGLGLSICKNLAELMDGTIWLETEEGVGTKFFLEMPFAVAPEGRLVPTTEAVEECACVGYKVLVVEDNVVNQKLVSAMLRRLKHEVTVVDNGQKGVDAVMQSQYDIVLMDIQMPVMVRFF